MLRQKECHEKSLTINKTIGHKEGEAAAHGGYGKATAVCNISKRRLKSQKKLAGDKEQVTMCYGHLRALFWSLGDYAKAKEYLGKALELHREAGHIRSELKIYS